MYFAPIVPISNLKKLAGLSSHQMILPQYLKNVAYRNFYVGRWSNGDFLILDNGCCELGESMPVETLLKHHEKLGGVDVIVIPDILSDINITSPEKSENMGMFDEFWNKYYYKMFEKVNPGVQFMAVPHSLGELEVMLKHTLVSLFGLNRDFEDIVGGRAEVVNVYKNKLISGARFHFLGIRESPYKELNRIKKEDIEFVSGIDSSLPYKLLKDGLKLSSTKLYPKPLNMHDKQIITREDIKRFSTYIAHVESLG